MVYHYVLHTVLTPVQLAKLVVHSNPRMPDVRACRAHRKGRVAGLALPRQQPLDPTMQVPINLQEAAVLRTEARDGQPACLPRQRLAFSLASTPHPSRWS